MRETRWLVDKDTKALKPEGLLATDSALFWYFWDETGTAAHGPYDTQAQAFEARDRYGKTL